MLNYSNFKAKSNAKFICQECGSTEMIQAHHQIPKDDSTIIVLCAECHSSKHPDIPKLLFLTKNHQPYWYNKSASSIAKETGLHPRTIIRRARRYNIPLGFLKPLDEYLLKYTTRIKHNIERQGIRRLDYIPSNGKFTMRISKETKLRLLRHGKKNESYDMVVSRLIDSYYANQNNY